MIFDFKEISIFADKIVLLNIRKRWHFNPCILKEIREFLGVEDIYHSMSVYLKHVA